MRLVTYEHAGRVRIGAWINNQVVDLSAAYQFLYPANNPDDPGLYSSMMKFLAQGETGLHRARAIIEKVEEGVVPSHLLFDMGQVSLMAPVPRPGKNLAVDYNYATFIHDACQFLQKKGVEVPEWSFPDNPWIFGKFSSTVIGPEEPILKPRDTKALDAEGELAVVIGKTGRFISEDEALLYVAGYTLFNDISDRDIEFRPSPSINHRLYTLGKNNDTFGPLGPCLFTKDEFSRLESVTIEVAVNGTILYAYSLSEAAFSIPTIVSYCSQMFQLEPGDIIATGSGGGCGAFKEPPVYLKPGDQVEVRVPGLPPLKNVVQDEGK